MKRLIDKSEKLANIGEQMGINPLDALNNLISLVSDYHKIDNIDYYLIRQKLLKLKELEGIEKQLGIELKTFVKLVRWKKQICFWYGTGKNRRIIWSFDSKWDFNPIAKSFMITYCNKHTNIDYKQLYFKDYGKVWAFVEEELQ